MTVELRDVTENDLSILFEQQWDPVANEMAAFLHVATRHSCSTGSTTSKGNIVVRM